MGKLRLLMLALVSVLVLVVMIPSAEARTVASDNLLLGNPSGATTSTAAETNYLIQRTQYALSYHRANGIANWVSWHLDSQDIGSTPRGDFKTDTSLPSGWYRVTTGDYTGSGYDRGHMTPSGDRTASTADNDAVFLMTNIIPQAPDNNQGPWNNLEQYSRDLTAQGNELYIISGGAGSRGTIAGGKVRIPDVTWKIIVVLPLGTGDLSRVTSSTRVIAITMPNVQGIRANDWHNYLTTVDSLESLTGYDFLSNVAPSIQSVLESRVDGAPLPTATPTPAPLPTATATPLPTATATPSSGSCATDLIISEYVEGSSSNKAIELFNGTASTITLSNYTLSLYANGGTSATTSATLSGVLAAGDTYVVAGPSSSATLLAKADATSGVINYNGNDALVLYRGTTVVDAFGDVGFDPGAIGWGSGLTSTTDHTLRRKATVSAGDTLTTDSFAPATQWDGFAVDTFDNLGLHAYSCQ
jgi:endonuclease G